MFQRFKEFIVLLQSSKTINIITLLVIVAAVPLTVFISQKQQDIRQRAATSLGNIIMDDSVYPGDDVKVIVKGPLSCSVNYQLNSSGLNNCGQLVGSCDGSGCQGTWMCKASNNLGNHMVVFTAANNANCTSYKNFTITNTIDTLSYFTGNYENKKNKELEGDHINLETGKVDKGTEYLSQTIYTEKLTSFYVKWQNPEAFEIHTLGDNGNTIYLKQDHSGDTFYNTFTQNVWMKKYMKIGEKIEHPENFVDRYGSDCSPLNVDGVMQHQSWSYTTTLEKRIPNFNEEVGELGTQNVIVLKYEYPPWRDHPDPDKREREKYEKFYYSKEWGWIRWELYLLYEKEYEANPNITENLFLKEKTVFNKILNNHTFPLNSPTYPPDSAICSGISSSQPNLPNPIQIPTISRYPTNTPTPSPTRVPTSTPTPTRVPTPTPTQPAIPTPTNSAISYPSLTITSPASYQYIKRGSSLTAKVSVSDSTGIKRVDYSFNGPILCTSSSSPYSCTFTVPTSLPPGYNTFKATAYNNLNLSTSKSLTVILY